MRKRIRRHGLAEHFDVDIRTIDSWAKKGILPKPHYLEGSQIPFWFVDETVEQPSLRHSVKTAS